MISKLELVERTRVLLEEMADKQEISYTESEGVNIVKYVEYIMDDTVNDVLDVTPIHWLTTKSFATATPERKNDGSGHVLMPNDVLRMVRFKMCGWEQPVTEFIGIDHPKALRQYNRYTRGGKAKPVCVLSPNSSDERRLFYYSLPAYLRVHQIEEADYVAYAKCKEGNYDIHPQLAANIALACADKLRKIIKINDTWPR